MKQPLFLFAYLTLLPGCADSPESYPYANQIVCTDFDGVCTNDPAIICGPGKEPYTFNDPQFTGCLGHCCITAEVSTSCNPKPADTDDSPIASYNCVPDDEGQSCPVDWEPVGGNLLCQEGRSCCFPRF